ncbi:MAG: hypothetical protein O9320_15995 [Magnetospirillum sp.]|nr:hypothetical protein [Magnetospirillum sp.]
MARPSIVPEIRAKLEPWLEARMAEWNAMPVDDRQATLPETPDGKINVRAVTLALGLRRTHEQHFFRHAELRTLLNATAEAQRLLPIGSREQIAGEDEIVRERFALVASNADKLAKSLAEREATILKLRTENDALRAQLRLLSEVGMTLRT